MSNHGRSSYWGYRWKNFVANHQEALDFADLIQGRKQTSAQFQKLLDEKWANLHEPQKRNMTYFLVENHNTLDGTLVRSEHDLACKDFHSKFLRMFSTYPTSWFVDKKTLYKPW